MTSDEAMKQYRKALVQISFDHIRPLGGRTSLTSSEQKSIIDAFFKDFDTRSEKVANKIFSQIPNPKEQQRFSQIAQVDSRTINDTFKEYIYKFNYNNPTEDE